MLRCFGSLDGWVMVGRSVGRVFSRVFSRCSVGRREGAERARGGGVGSGGRSCCPWPFRTFAPCHMSAGLERVVELKVTTDGVEKYVQTTAAFQAFVDRAAVFVKKMTTKERKRQCDPKVGLDDMGFPPAIIGVVGGAGSGKSTFCEILCARLNGATWNLPSITIGMDGYHFPNAQLKARGLMPKKGSLETIDSGSIRNDLARFFLAQRSPSFSAAEPGQRGEDAAQLEPAKEREPSAAAADDNVGVCASSNPGVLAFPMYDRNLHDPVLDKIIVDPDYHKVVLFEGLHLLTDDHGDWEAIRTLFHGLIVLQVPLSICEERVVRRKVFGGKSESDARKHWANTDLQIHEQINIDIASLCNATAPEEGLAPPVLVYSYQ
eukprot:Stramenopile-MAST_4_protein_2818